MSLTVTTSSIQNYPGDSPALSPNEGKDGFEKLNKIILLVDQRKSFCRKMNCALLTTFLLLSSGGLILNETLAKESVASATNCIGIGLLVSGGLTLGVTTYMGIRGCILGRKIIQIYHDLNPLARYKGKNSREVSFSTSSSALELGELEETKNRI